MSTSSALLLASLAAGIVGACGGTRSAGRTAPPRDANVITAEELEASRATTLYDAVRALRPGWARRSGPITLAPEADPSANLLIVYLDGVRFGTLETLRSIHPKTVFSVRYYTPSAAEGRFGAGHLGGAIEVTTRTT